MDYNKEDIVLALITKATKHRGADITGIGGGKTLQKSMYFFNQKVKTFDYKWGDHGPLCELIQHVIGDLIEREYVVIVDVFTEKRGMMKNLQSSGNALVSGEIPNEINKGLDETISFVTGKSPDELEFLASVHFWAIRQQESTDDYSIEYILETLVQLNPKTEYNEWNVMGAIGMLEANGYLTPK